MKSLSIVTVLLLVLFFITSGNAIESGETIDASIRVGSCDRVFYRGSCLDSVCDRSCKNKYGDASHGFCYSIDAPNDTCVCRIPDC